MALKINGIRVAGVGADGKNGAGVVAGGTAGQVLVKKTEIDYDTQWVDLPSIDTTLSNEGQAADAKAVGQQITNITNNYETKTDASAKLSEAKSYADSAAAAVKNDLLNGAGEAYDTLKELGDLITENVDAIEALEQIASNPIISATQTKASEDYIEDDAEVWVFNCGSSTVLV